MPTNWLSVADEDTVELISGNPRSSNSRSRSLHRDYIPLDVLDEDGTGPKHPRRSLLDKAAMKKLVYIPFAVAFALIILFAWSFGSPKPAYSLISNGTTDFYPTTIVISLDGLHPHYISAERTPYIDNMLNRAAVVPYMQPSFPSQTFPNHWTLATGLYPGNHGIVGNNFWDTKLGEFQHSEYETLSQQFWGGEPIWQTARRQNRISAVHMWPGSDFENSANYVDKFNQTEDLSVKADRLMEWLDLPIEERPQLIMMYVPDIDTTGHEHGIAGPELEATLKRVDDFIALVDQGLSRRSLGEIANLIVLSDHGMAPTSDERILFLDDYLDMSLVEHKTAWPNIGIRLKDEFRTTQIRLNLTRNIPPEKAIVFDGENFPPDWHFGGNMAFSDRIAPIYITPAIGYSIVTRDEYNGEYPLKGVHGYAPDFPMMRAFFMGVGPKFNVGKYAAFNNVNIYPLLCKLLNIKPSKNDGKAKFEPFNATTYQENYPGTDLDIEYFENSTFTDFGKKKGPGMRI